MTSDNKAIEGINEEISKSNEGLIHVMALDTITNGITIVAR